MSTRNSRPFTPKSVKVYEDTLLSVLVNPLPTKRNRTNQGREERYGRRLGVTEKLVHISTHIRSSTNSFFPRLHKLLGVPLTQTWRSTTAPRIVYRSRVIYRLFECGLPNLGTEYFGEGLSLGQGEVLSPLIPQPTFCRLD